MEENKEITDDKIEKDVEKEKDEEFNEIKNEEEESKQLLIEKDKNEDINIINKDINNEQKKESLINNKEIIEIKSDNDNHDIPKNIKNEQNLENNPNLMITDYLITIQYSKVFHIPYFIFGNMLNFYFPFHKFEKKVINLSQMPTPTFAIVITQYK